MEPKPIETSLSVSAPSPVTDNKTANLTSTDSKTDQASGSIFSQLQKVSPVLPQAEIHAKEGAPPQEAHLNIPPIVPPVAVPLTDQQVIDAINKIKDLALNNPGSLSTQALMSEILKEAAKLGSDYHLDIKSTINPKLETFTVPSAPGDAYYKVGVAYQLTLTKNGQKVGDIPDIQRDIYTTSKTADGAMVAANDFKRTVIELAKASADPDNYKGRFKFKELGPAERDEVLKQKSFKFKYNFSSDGKPTGLLSIHGLDANQKDIDLLTGSDPDASNFIYYHDDKNQVQRLEKAKAGTMTGKAIYGSEEEALLNLKLEISDKDPFDRISKSQSLDQQLSEIKDRIKKKEESLAQIKGHFIQKGLLSSSETKEFKTFIADQAHEKGKNIPEKDLSPEMRRKLELDKKLKQSTSGNAILDDQAVKSLTDELSQVNSKIQNDRAIFLKHYASFQKEISDLQKDLTLLENIKKGATAKTADATATDQVQQIATHIGQSITDKEIDTLKKLIAEHQKTIGEIALKMKS